MTRRRRRLRLALTVIVPIAVLAVLRPWTVRPLQTVKAGFDARSYVQAAWSEVLREADRIATEVGAMPSSIAPAGAAAPGGPKARFLRGTAIVAAVDRESRVGLARLELDRASASLAVALQIGPVLRGTAVRDAASFIRFSDFANQSDFAAVANALNERVLETVLAPIDVAALSGRTVSFIGAAGAPRDGRILEIVPLSLQIAGGGR